MKRYEILVDAKRVHQKRKRFQVEDAINSHQYHLNYSSRPKWGFRIKKMSDVDRLCIEHKPSCGTTG
jgi:hypothetical protein